MVVMFNGSFLQFNGSLLHVAYADTHTCLAFCSSLTTCLIFTFSFSSGKPGRRVLTVRAHALPPKPPPALEWNHMFT